MFRSSHFLFLVFGHHWQAKLRKYINITQSFFDFARQDGQDGKKRKKNKTQEK